jgi:putative transposase
MLELLKYAFGFLQDCFKSRRALALENIALRTQLALYQEKQAKGIVPKPQCTPRFRMTWILLSRFFAEWKDALCVVKPETVMRWHKIGFKNFWRRKSRRKHGRPVVSTEVRRLIKKINAENPLWSPERIHDQLAELGFSPPSPNAIRKYLPKTTRDTNASLQTRHLSRIIWTRLGLLTSSLFQCLRSGSSTSSL